ncbi:hypothetical protein N656DRAFT_34870 [Canariomyces notabilis]|uniref:RRM domain-containing protein n=1 Tax=Canariomyces notabilis TaxID=2074819 RepID=A0AAN6TMW2_9PEZI|nr:hypothetical protein N656DRAFT_34870 [Canariomyces arenarius]
MNQIRAIQALNKREIEDGIPPEASWHTDYRDTAFVYFGGLPYELSEGDIITIFSQFGEPVFLKLVRDKETGKSKGFGWLKYEDQRSTDLAVDNLGGAEIGGRLIRVDHARYKARDDDDLDEYRVGWEDMLRRERAEKGLPSEDESGDETDEDKARRARPLIKEERELQLLIQEHDDEDPMKQFLIDEKKKEVEEALKREARRSERRSRKDKDRDRDHRHRSHRSKRDESAHERQGRDKDRHKYRNRDSPESARDHRRRRDESPSRDRSDDDKRERRRRDSSSEDRGRDDRHDGDQRRRDGHHQRDERNDYYRKSHGDHRRDSPEDTSRRREHRHRDLEDRRRRDRDSYRSRSPRSYGD